MDIFFFFTKKNIIIMYRYLTYLPRAIFRKIKIVCSNGFKREEFFRVIRRRRQSIVLNIICTPTGAINSNYPPFGVLRADGGADILFLYIIISGIHGKNVKYLHNIRFLIYFFSFFLICLYRTHIFGSGI